MKFESEFRKKKMSESENSFFFSKTHIYVLHTISAFQKINLLRSFKYYINY